MPAGSSRKREREFAGDTARPLGALILTWPPHSARERAPDATGG